MSSVKKNNTRDPCQERECEAGSSGGGANRTRPCMKRTPEDEEIPGRKTMDEGSGTLKRCLSESFVQPGSSKNSPLDLSESGQDSCGVKPLLTEASKSYRNSLLINQKLPARSIVGSGSHTRLSSRIKSHRDSPWPSKENLLFLKKNRAALLVPDDAPPDGMEREDTEDPSQLKGKYWKSNEVTLADRLALWDPWAGVGVAFDQAEQRPVVVVHSEPAVTTSSILKTGRPISEQGGAQPQTKRVKWCETVDVILYSGDSEVGRHQEQLREEWAASIGIKRCTIDRCPHIDPGPLH